MSSNSSDCSAIEERINGQNLSISSAQDQINKLDPQDSAIQNKKEALARKLNNLREQLGLLQQALEDCRQGKGSDFPTLEVVSEDDSVCFDYCTSHILRIYSRYSGFCASRRVSS